MLAGSVSLFFVVISTFVRSSASFNLLSECQCVVENATYEVGEAWSDDAECVKGLFCVGDNVYKATDCSELQWFMEGEYVILKNDSESFPSCCLNSSVDSTTVDPSLFDFSMPDSCTRDNETFQVGDQEELLGECVYSECTGNNTWLRKLCALLVVPEGWNLTAMDKTKPYPECCEKVVPVLDIVPDVVDHVHFGDILQVTYPGNLSVTAGQVLTPTQVKDEPQIKYSADANTFYLLFMVDPDAPSRADPKLREILHWLVGNIPGSNVTAGDVLAAYVGSGAPQGTGLHRYIFLLYKQPGKLQFDEPRVPNTSRENRPSFSVRKFAEKYKLGQPVAYNVFQAEYDEYVPILHKQLDGGK